MSACGSSLHVCALRATLLDATGNVADVDDNSYVTNEILTVAINPVVSPGADVEVIGGCDCVVVSFKGADKLKRFDFQVAKSAIEPILVNMLIGATAIMDGADVVGTAWPGPLACGVDSQQVAIEFWADHWVDDAPDPQYPYVHLVHPSASWQIGPQTLQNQFAEQQIVGNSRKNPVWGEGPYGDGPPNGADISFGGRWFTDIAPPTGDCEATTVEPSS